MSVDFIAKFLTFLIQLVLDVLIFLCTEQLLHQIGARFRTHSQKLRELPLRQHNRLRKLTTIQSQQSFHFPGDIARTRGDRNRMVRLVKKIEIPIDGTGANRNNRSIRIAGKRCESHFATVRNPRHFAGRVLLCRAFTTLFRPLVFGCAPHRVIVPAFLEYQMHVSLVSRTVQEP